MKVNKPKSPYASGADAPAEKDIAKAVKGEKFADALAALDAGGLVDGDGINSALKKSAEFFVKERLGEKFKGSEQTVSDLSNFVSDDPFFKTKMLSVLNKLREK